MRLFVAVRPPLPAVHDLEERLATLRGAADDARPNPPAGLRWTPPEQWHLTLAFLGEVEERRYAELTTRLARAASRNGELPLGLAGAGTFPRRADRARVLWSGVAGDSAGLARLAAGSRAAARRSRIPVEEDARFSAHLTLARARSAGGADVTRLVAALSAYAGPAWTAAELELVRSHLGPVVRHETVARWPLGRVHPPNE